MGNQRSILASGMPCLASLFLLACATETPRPVPPPRPAQPIFDFTIVPQVRIGPATLGMSDDDLLRWLGPPSETFSFKDGWFQYTYGRLGLSVRVSSDGYVRRASTSDARYAMTNGVRVGSTALEVNVKLGSPAWRTSQYGHVTLCYEDQTMISIDSSGVATSIQINQCNPDG